MRTLLASLLLCWIVVSSPALAQDDGVRFSVVDIYLDSAEPIAAWQFEFSDRANSMRIVGVENGDSSAFGRPPYYDREAVSLGTADRIIVADYSLASPENLPMGRTRIATLHLMLSGHRPPEFELRLVTAVTYDGTPANASIGLEVQTGREQ